MSSALEVTQYFPKPGRTPPARLQLVRSNPFEEEERTACQPSLTWDDILRMRGELPAPKPSKPARSKAPKAPRASPCPVAPWNRKGFVYPEPTDSQGKAARLLASCQEDMARIRTTPKNLAALLKTAEWKGARVEGTVPSPEIGAVAQAVAESERKHDQSVTEVATLEARLAESDLGDKVRKTLEINLSAARAALSQCLATLNNTRARLETVRAEEWIRVVHPSGATITIRPSWGE